MRYTAAIIRLFVCFWAKSCAIFAELAIEVTNGKFKTRNWRWAKSCLGRYCQTPNSHCNYRGVMYCTLGTSLMARPSLDNVANAWHGRHAIYLHNEPRAFYSNSHTLRHTPNVLLLFYANYLKKCNFQFSCKILTTLCLNKKQVLGADAGHVMIFIVGKNLIRSVLFPGYGARLWIFY